VTKILTNRILKSRFLFVNDLCPVAVVWTPENPAGVMLGFNDKNTRVRDNNVINLGRSIIGLKRHVVK